MVLSAVFAIVVTSMPSRSTSLRLALPHVATTHGNFAARAKFSRARTRESIDARPLRSLFYLAVRSGDLAKATRIGSLYASRRPRDETFALDRAFVFVRLKRYELARALFDAVSRSKDSRLASTASTANHIVSELIDARERSGILKDAYVARKRGDLIAAVSAFQLYLTKARPQPSVLLELAYAQHDLHAYPLALDAFDRYVAAVPNDDRAKLARAYELIALDRTADARDVFETLQSSGDQIVAMQATRELKAVRTTPTAAPASTIETAYELLHEQRLEEAAVLLRRAFDDGTTSPSNVLDLAFIYAGAGDHRNAALVFDSYLQSDPTNDRIRLARAFELTHGEKMRARELFAELSNSTDDAVRQRARTELAAAAGSNRGRHSLETFSVVEYDSRLNDVFINIDSRIIASSGRVRAYQFDRIATDTRSEGAGSAPLVLNDNALVGGVGVRAAIGESTMTYAFAEAGQAASLLGRPGSLDLRLGLASSVAYTNERGVRNTIDWSATSYSRYAGNIIGYFQGMREYPLGQGRVRGIVGTRAVIDSHREFYNNIFELQGGVQIGSQSFAIRFLGVAGTYLPIGKNVPKRPFYVTVRPQLLFSRSF